MKVSYSWLKDFVDLKLKPQELADKLTMAGLNVASLEQIDGDWVYDIEVASNRPDCLSIRGIAREVAAITGCKFKQQQAARCKPQAKKKQFSLKPGAGGMKPLTISIEDKKGCRLYYGNLIRGVKVGPSPGWLVKRLESVGLRSINNVVDITNYCLMEYGQPLHAFDFDKIENATICVRRAHDKEKIILIDGSDKELNSHVLVIADNRRPVAVAGIMGAANTEVSSQTTDVLLESAYFDPVVVRRGSRWLGISSDSSYRFERGVDVSVVWLGLTRATQMICDLCGGRLAASEHSGPAVKLPPRKISFNLKVAREILNLHLSTSQAACILKRLGFAVNVKTSNIFRVIVPIHRRDVKTAEDLIEEIARIHGYDRIPLTTPSIRPFSFEVSPEQILKQRLKALLVSMGLKEIITYSLVSDADYQKSSLDISKETLSLENPLSQDYSMLRTTMVPSLLSCIAFNASHNNRNFEIFEIAHMFKRESEPLSLGIALVGSRRATWQKESQAHSLFDIKGIIENLLDELQIRNYEVKSASIGFAEEGTGCEVVVGGKTLACFGKISETVKKSWGIKCREDVFVAEVSVNALVTQANLRKSFAPLSSTPSIFRDISVLVPEDVSYAQIKRLIQQKTQGYLKDIVLVERYQGREIPRDKTGLTISVEYGSDQKTLTEAEIAPVHQDMLNQLVKDLSLTLR